MKKIQTVFMTLIISLAFVSFMACSSGGGSDTNIKIGSSCEGITGGKFYCDGSTVLFCSSFTKFKYQKQSECPAGQVCQANADSTSTKCVAK